MGQPQHSSAPNLLCVRLTARIPGIPPGIAIASKSSVESEWIIVSAMMLTPREHFTAAEPDMDTSVTIAPARTRVSTIQTVSISSLPSAMGTKTCPHAITARSQLFVRVRFGGTGTLGA